MIAMLLFFFFSSRRRHTRSLCDWSSDVCSSDLDRAEWLPSLSGRERQLDPECRSPANLRCKVYRTVVELYNSEGAGESDAAAAGSRCKEELENLLTIFERDPSAGIADGDLGHFAAAAEHHAKLSAGGHGFDGIQDEIEERLFEQRAIDVD